MSTSTRRAVPEPIGELSTSGHGENLIEGVRNLLRVRRIAGIVVVLRRDEAAGSRYPPSGSESVSSGRPEGDLGRTGRIEPWPTQTKRHEAQDEQRPARTARAPADW
jgi:hypothetical protein